MSNIQKKKRVNVECFKKNYINGKSDAERIIRANVYKNGFRIKIKICSTFSEMRLREQKKKNQ